MMENNENKELEVVDDSNGYLDEIEEENTEVEEMDNLNQEQLEQLRQETKKLSEAGDAAYITMAGNLYEIRKSKSYKGWKYDKFRDYVETELSISLRKAEYLMQIWDYYVEKVGGGSKALLDKVKGLGLTKLKDCINVIKPDNVDKVLDQIKDLSVRRVAEIKKEINISVDIAKDTESDSKTVDSEDVDDLAASTKHSMNFKLYSEQYKSVKDALELSGKIGNTKCRNTQLRYISEEFLSLHQTGDSDKSRLDACERFEKLYNVKILVADAVSGTILYGEDIEEKLSTIVKAS